MALKVRHAELIPTWGETMSTGSDERMSTGLAGLDNILKGGLDPDLSLIHISEPTRPY